LRIYRLDQARLDSGLTHEIFMFLTPQSRHCQNPSDFSRYNLSDLFSEFLHCLLANEPQSHLDQFEQLHFPSID
jgi:hypothetical protein